MMHSEVGISNLAGLKFLTLQLANFSNMSLSQFVIEKDQSHNHCGQGLLIFLSSIPLSLREMISANLFIPYF